MEDKQKPDKAQKTDESQKIRELTIKNQELTDILEEISEYNQKITELLDRFNEITGKNFSATVKDKKQLRNLLSKYSQLK